MPSWKRCNPPFQRTPAADYAASNSLFARSQALLGNVVLQAGACLVYSQSGDWELARSYQLKHRVNNKEMTTNTAKEHVRFTAWMLTKYCILFVIISAFVAYNFNNPIAALLLATAITGLSIAHSHIFDAASNSFLDVQADDDATDKRNKLAATVAKRVLYTLLDYGLAALSIGLAVLAKQIGLSYHLAIAAMWLLIDITSAASLVYIYETSGRDMTLAILSSHGQHHLRAFQNLRTHHVCLRNDLGNLLVWP